MGDKIFEDVLKYQKLNKDFTKGEFEKTDAFEKRLAALLASPMESRLYVFPISGSYNADTETLTLPVFTKKTMLICAMVTAQPGAWKETTEAGLQVEGTITLQGVGILDCINRDGLNDIYIKLSPETAATVKGDIVFVAAFTPVPQKGNDSGKYELAYIHTEVPAEKPAVADPTKTYLVEYHVHGKLHTIYIVRNKTGEILHIEQYN